MLLGKRSRHPIKRTTSMTGITVDVSNNVEDVVVQEEPIISDPNPPPQNHPLHEFPDAYLGYDQRFLAMVSPRYPASGRSAFSSSSTYHAVDSATTAPFLRSCWLCNRRLAPGRDIYMYRGDTAFCSLECREQQMRQDERKEKLNMTAAGSKKEERQGHASSTTASKASAEAEPVVAA